MIQGQNIGPTNEICMRHAEGVRSDNPVLGKTLVFLDKPLSQLVTHNDCTEYSTGAYHREFIRANMDKTFETMVQEGTIAWPMIMHLR